MSTPTVECPVLHARVVSGTGGGPEKTILSSAAFLRDTKYDLTAAYIHPRGDSGFETIRERAAVLGSPLVGIGEGGALDPRSLVALWKLCRKLKTKIWHGHDYKTNLFGLMLRPLLPKMKLVTTVHGWVVHTSRTPLYYRVDKWCLPRYDRVLCVSDDLVETCRSVGVAPSRLELLPNAIDVDYFQRAGCPADATLRRERCVQPGRLVIGAIGRLMPEKSFDMLIASVASLVQSGRNIELWIAGEGPEHGKLARLIQDQGLEDRIKLLGFVDDPKSFFESLDIFALSSQREGLPNVVLEAAAMCVPIVSTRVAGIPGMLTHGKHALLCEVGDGHDLTEHLNLLISDAELRSSLSLSARELVEMKYSFRKRMDRMSAIYELLSRR